jgi:signal peptidase I
MKIDQRLMGYLQAALTLMLFGIAWFDFAPVQVGGRSAYVVVTGNSMEPLLQYGDLAVLSRTHDYQVGDVVVYSAPRLGSVIHRIVARDGDRFIMQGDNNGWIDSHQPTEEEIMGELWFRIPKAGRVVHGFQTPLGAALLAGVVGILLLWPDPEPPESQAQEGRSQAGRQNRPLAHSSGDPLASVLAHLAPMASKSPGRHVLTPEQTERLDRRLKEIGAALDGIPLLLFQSGRLIAWTDNVPPAAANLIARRAERMWRSGATRPARAWLRINFRSAALGDRQRAIVLYFVHLTGDLRLAAIWDGKRSQSSLCTRAVKAAQALRGLLWTPKGFRA